MNRNFICAILLILLFLWQLFLWIYFPVSGLGLIISVVLIASISVIIYLILRHYKSNFKFFIVAILSLVLGLYTLTVLHPDGEQNSDASSELRSAISSIIHYDSLSPLLLYSIPSSPFSPNTATLHRNQKEAPEYAFFVSFSDKPDDKYLFTVVNDNVGTNLEGFKDAFINDNMLKIILSDNRREIEFEIPLEYKNRPLTLYSRLDSNEILVEYLYTEVDSQLPFQQLYWKILDLIFKE